MSYLTEIRRAGRRLLGVKGFSLTVVFTLSLGIGVMSSIFALVEAVLLQPLPYSEPDLLVAVRHTARVDLPMNGLSAGTFLYYRDNNRVFENIGVYVRQVFTVTAPGEPEEIHAALVSPSLFSVLRVTPQIGRLPQASDFQLGVRAGVLISEELWRLRFDSDPNIVGRMIEIDRHPNVIVGVARHTFHFPDDQTQIWIGWPQEALVPPGGPTAGLDGLYKNAVARMKPGVTVGDAQRDLDRLIRDLPKTFSDLSAERLNRIGLRASVIPLKDAMVGSVRAPLLLLSVIGAVLLLITWANTANLCLLRAERQGREIALERALGAPDSDIWRRFGSETLLLSGAGGMLALLFSFFAVRARFGFSADTIPRLSHLEMNFPTVGVLLGLILLTAVLLGAIAFFSSRKLSLTAMLSGGSGRLSSGKHEQNGRRILVAGQVALALVLLVASAMITESFWRLRQVHLGFAPAGLLTFRLPLPATVYGDYYAAARVNDAVLGRLRAIPGVSSVEACDVSGFPLRPVPEDWKGSLIPARQADTEAEGPIKDETYSLIGFATPGYFRTMKIALLRGRSFGANDMNRGTPGVVVSNSLARALFHDGDPLGAQIRVKTEPHFPPYTVIGVVSDVPGESLRDGPSKVLYLPNVYPPQADSVTGIITDRIPNEEIFVLRTNLPFQTVMPAVSRAVHEIDSKLVLTQARSLSDVVGESLSDARLTMSLLLVGTFSAVILGLVGLYGVLAYVVRQRSNELGIRLAIGASPTTIMRSVVRDGALLTLIGIAVGVPIAFAFTRSMRVFLFQVSPIDPVIFVVMPALLLFAALLASYVPARRAGQIDPIRVLRGD